MASPVASAAKSRILLTDDSQTVRNIIRDLIAGLNPIWEISEACNGAEAIQKAIALKPDVAMVDLNLPDMDGLKLAKQIRQVSPMTKIVLCSLNDSSVLARLVQDSDADAFLSKTASPEEFGATLTALMLGSR